MYGIEERLTRNRINISVRSKNATKRRTLAILPCNAILASELHDLNG